MKRRSKVNMRKELGRESRYAKKVRQGNQLYGPGCCANGRQSKTGGEPT